MNIYALCTLGSGANLLRILSGRMPLAGVIGLGTHSKAETVSDFVLMEPIARDIGIPFLPVSTYSLNGEGDKKTLLASPMDALIVCGWQRLVPEWLIAHANSTVIGIHGSSDGISDGRGRSPQNWAIILGAREFSLSIFYIDQYVDSGEVISTRKFKYDSHDDIASSYLKTTLLAADMIADAFAGGALSARRGTPQETGGYYLPQRVPQDGAMDWRRSTADLARFVAALSRPYPGAFSTLHGYTVRIWRARPFNLDTVERIGRPGRIIVATEDGRALVETDDGILLIDELTIEGMAADPYPIMRGAVFDSVDFENQIRSIVERHEMKHKDMPVAPALLHVLKK